MNTIPIFENNTDAIIIDEVNDKTAIYNPVLKDTKTDDWSHLSVIKVSAVLRISNTQRRLYASHNDY